MNGPIFPLKSGIIKEWMDLFILDRRIRKLSSNRINYYQRQLADFEKFLGEHHVILMSEITADLLNDYVLSLDVAGHHIEGIRGKFGAVRAFLRWYETQAKPKDWENPIKKINLPKDTSLANKLAVIADINAMIATCKNDFVGSRDKAIMICLLEKALRADELVKININDIDLNSGSLVIRSETQQTVLIGREARQAIREYIRFRSDKGPPALWITSKGNRITRGYLSAILFHRGKLAGVHTPSINDFIHL